MSMPQGGGSEQSDFGQAQPGPAQPGQAQYGQAQYGQAPYGQAPYGQPAPGFGGGGGPMSGQPISPVNEIETRVTGKRIVQYIVDIILYGIVASLLSFALDRGHGGVAAVLVIVLVLVDIAWYFLYWAYIPSARNGQTVGMSLLGLRVISAAGGPASLGQLFVRSIFVVLFGPVAWLVGIITMMCSRYRQRVGDHLAKTMVVSATVGAGAGAHEFAGAGQSGSR